LYTTALQNQDNQECFQHDIAVMRLVLSQEDDSIVVFPEKKMVLLVVVSISKLAKLLSCAHLYV
jgi:hypothetical protein